MQLHVTFDGRKVSLVFFAAGPTLKMSLRNVFALRAFCCCLSVPVELSTRYTTPDTTVEIGSMSATVE